MTPREVMLNNMHFFMQGAYDWQDHLMRVVEQPRISHRESVGLTCRGLD